jgi:ketosteroid isomerase-like protein
MDDDIVMRSVLDEAVASNLAGTSTGKAAARAYFADVQLDWEQLSYEVEKLVADGDDVVMVGRCRYRHRATGREVDTPKVDVWQFRQGKVVDFLEMFDSHEFVRALPAAGDG